MQPWQFFHMARKHLGVDVVARIFNREKRSAYSWAQDPDTTQYRCQNPLEALHRVFSKMDDYGLGYAVDAAINYLKTARDESELGDAIPGLLPTMQEEQLADYKCLADFQAAIDAGEPPEGVKRLKQFALEEIERTYAKYLKDKS